MQLWGRNYHICELEFSFIEVIEHYIMAFSNAWYMVVGNNRLKGTGGIFQQVKWAVYDVMGVSHGSALISSDSPCPTLAQKLDKPLGIFSVSKWSYVQ